MCGGGGGGGPGGGDIGEAGMGGYGGSNVGNFGGMGGGGGPGGYGGGYAGYGFSNDAISFGANISAGNPSGIPVGSGFGGYEAGATGDALGDSPVAGPGPGTPSVSDMFSTQHLSKSDKAALAIVNMALPVPLAGTLVTGMVNSARGAGQPEGNVGDIGGPGSPYGGPGADVIPTPAPRYTGPPAPAMPVAPVPVEAPKDLTPIAPEIVSEIRTGAPFSVEKGRTPAEIDAANRLRAAREKAYAAQRAEAEAELLKALSMRDVAYVGGPESKLAESGTSRQRFVGLPPTLGQSRHYWA